MLMLSLCRTNIDDKFVGVTHVDVKLTGVKLVDVLS